MLHFIIVGAIGAAIFLALLPAVFAGFTLFVPAKWWERFNMPVSYGVMRGLYVLIITLIAACAMSAIIWEAHEFFTDGYVTINGSISVDRD